MLRITLLLLLLAAAAARAQSSSQNLPISVTTGQLFGVNLAGAEFGSTYPGTYGSTYTYPTASELTYYAGKGLTLIRMPIRWERIQPTLNAALDTGSSACSSTGNVGCINAVLAAADAVPGIRVIIDVHNYGRFCGAGTFGDTTSCGTIIGTSPVTNAAFQDLWTRLAAAFGPSGSNHPSLLGYDIMNEPHDMGASSVWPAAAQAAANGIRSADTVHTIFIEGDCWAGAVTWTSCNNSLNITDNTNNLRYEAHEYFDSNNSGNYAQSYAAQCPSGCALKGNTDAAGFLSWLSSNGHNGYVGEYGVPNSDSNWATVMDNFLTDINAADVWGTYWAGGPLWNWCGGGTTIQPAPSCSGGADAPIMSTVDTHQSH
jgi:endoglucanase